jgi:hypothetical protein
MYSVTIESSGVSFTTNDIAEAVSSARWPNSLIMQGSVLVAFHCGFTNKVKPTKNASDYVRSALA